MAKVLSIFFDESGDQGLYDSESPFYILSMVFHDQSQDISAHIQNFNGHLRQIGLDDHPIHTGPLIRKEPPYNDLPMETRKKLFVSLLNFMRRTGVKYGVISFEKAVTCSESVSVSDILKQELNDFLLTHEHLFRGFNKVVGYYDNGQKHLPNIIGEALRSLPITAEMRKIAPFDYRLGQAADMVCTMQLLDIKASRAMLTRSDLDFFGGSQKLKKNYLKQFMKYMV